MEEELSAEHELVMPFVVCKSRGGPYEDDDWVAGYEMGIIDGQLSVALPDKNGLPIQLQSPRWVRTDNVPQLDLIVMSHGCFLEKGEVLDGWTHIQVHRATNAQ